jgi:PAS domain S-box-containing protein
MQAMRIKTQFILTIAILGTVVLLIVASVIVTDQQMAQVDQQQDISGNIERGVDELNNISAQYLLFQQSKELSSWQSNVASISGNLSSLNTATPEQQTLVRNAVEALVQLNATFSYVVQFLETVPQEVSLRFMPEFQEIWTQMMTEQRVLAFDTSQVSESFRVQGDQLTLRNTMLVTSLLGVFGLFLLSVYIITYRRTLKSIENLQDGINFVSSGDLEHAVSSDRKDEIGELSNSFNQMTANLKTVTASKKDLEAEIAERKKAERQLESAREALQRERGILQTIMNSPKNMHLVYLDRDFNFVRVNEAYAKTCGYTPEEMVGKNHFQLYPDEENETIFKRVRDTGMPVQFHDKPFVFPDQPERGITYWDWTLEAIKNDAGNIEGLVFALVETTERKQLQLKLENYSRKLEEMVEDRTTDLLQSNKRLKAEIKRRERTVQSLQLEEARLDALLQLSQIGEASLRDIANFTLEYAIALTNSKIGFVGFLNEDETVYTLHAVSKDIVKECNVTGDPMQWHVVDAGIWADAIRERRTLFVNDYSPPDPRKRGFPPGHRFVNKFMVVPLLERERVVALAGVGKKAADYDKSDERQVALLLKGMLSYLQKAEAETRESELVKAELRERELSEEKLRAASLYVRSLIEASLDPLVTINAEGKITDVNKATEIVTGVSRESLVGSDFSDYFTEPEGKERL